MQAAFACLSELIYPSPSAVRHHHRSFLFRRVQYLNLRGSGMWNASQWRWSEKDGGRTRARGRMYIEPADPKKKTRPRVRIRYCTSVLLIRRSRNKLAHVVQTSTIPTISQIESIMSQTLENAFTSTYVLRAMAMVMQVLHRIFGTFSVQVGVRRSRIDPPTPHPLFFNCFLLSFFFFYPFIYVSTFRLWSDQIRVKGWRRTEAYRSGGREARAAYEQNTMLI